MRAYANQPPGTVTRARTLRRDATDAERALWAMLRESFPDRRFRRQVPIGPYFADFLSHRARLVIEVDGGQHAEAQAYDARRTAFIEREGYRVLRLWNNDVLANPEGAHAAIANALGPSPSHAARGPLPLPMGEGEHPSPTGRGKEARSAGRVRVIAPHGQREATMEPHP